MLKSSSEAHATQFRTPLSLSRWLRFHSPSFFVDNACCTTQAVCDLTLRHDAWRVAHGLGQGQNQFGVFFGCFQIPKKNNTGMRLGWGQSSRLSTLLSALNVIPSRRRTIRVSGIHISDTAAALLKHKWRTLLRERPTNTQRLLNKC